MIIVSCTYDIVIFQLWNVVRPHKRTLLIKKLINSASSFQNARRDARKCVNGNPALKEGPFLGRPTGTAPSLITLIFYNFHQEIWQSYSCIRITCLPFHCVFAVKCFQFFLLTEYWSVTSSNFHFCITALFLTIFQLVHNGPRYGCLNVISPIEIGLVHNCYEPGQFALISVGLIKYSSGHISGPYEQISAKFWLWMFFIMFHRYTEMPTLSFEIAEDFCEGTEWLSSSGWVQGPALGPLVGSKGNTPWGSKP